MIKSAQRKFITIVMIILFLVFALIFSVYFLILKNINDNNITQTLNEIEAEITTSLSPPKVVPQNCIIAIFHSIDGHSTTTEIQYDTDVFDKQKANSVVSSIVSESAPFGMVGSIYYKFVSYPQNNTNVLVALDKAESMSELNGPIIFGAIVILVIYFVMFLVAWRLSFFVFQPIKESFYKQREFISNASHELKTPLAIISANADVISSKDDNPYLDSIKSQTKRLGILVKDMLSLAKMDEVKTPLTSSTFNISDEIIVDLLAFDAVAFELGKTIETKITPSLFYKGDLNSVKNIVNIIMDNAVKHASVGGTIFVELKKENGKIIFTVLNSGSQVPDKDSNKVFERFYRPDDSRSRSSGGSGLGLAIAKGIADSNKWKISAQSKLGESMKITVIFV